VTKTLFFLAKLILFSWHKNFFLAVGKQNVAENLDMRKKLIYNHIKKSLESDIISVGAYNRGDFIEEKCTE